MLGKLVKNSFKANFSSVSNVYLAMGIMAVVVGASYLFDWTKVGESGVWFGFGIKALVDVALILTSVIGTIMTLVGVISEFNKNFFGPEGHLTLALPVRSSTLLLSKWISGSFWIGLSYLLIYVCVIGSAIDLANYSMSVINSYSEFSSVSALFTEGLEAILAAAGVNMPSFAVLLSYFSIVAFDGAVRVIIFVLLMFFAITISHCRPFHKLGKFGKIVYFFISTFAVSTFAKMITSLVKIYLLISETTFSFTLSEADVAMVWDMGCAAYPITNLYCTAIAGVFVFLITTVLIDRHVNVS